MTDVRIYVASLADYNAGILHGTWIDIAESDDVEDVQISIDVMLGNSLAVRKGLTLTAEDYAIHDHEGFDGYPLSENESLDDVVALAHGIAEHGEAFAYYANEVGVDNATANFNDAFRGEQSLVEYAWEFAEYEIGLKDFALRYFDAESFARDLRMGGDMFTLGAFGEYLFESNV